MSALERYQQLLATHDWHYAYSDDHKVWRTGIEQWRSILTLGREVDPTGQIRNDFYNTHIKKG